MAKHRRHTEEFKQAAVKLVTEQGYSQAEAARSLGIHENQIVRWRKKYAPGPREGESMKPETEQEELQRLREENRRLRMERDILKKAAVFFATEKN
jgi:transposase